MDSKFKCDTYRESDLYAVIYFNVKGFEGRNKSKPYYFKIKIGTAVNIDDFVLVNTALGINIGHVINIVNSSTIDFEPTETIICGLSKSAVNEYVKSKRLKESSITIKNAYKRFTKVVDKELKEVEYGVCSACPLSKVCDTVQYATMGKCVCQLLDK